MPQFMLMALAGDIEAATRLTSMRIQKQQSLVVEEPKKLFCSPEQARPKRIEALDARKTGSIMVQRRHNRLSFNNSISTEGSLAKRRNRKMTAFLIPT